MRIARIAATAPTTTSGFQAFLAAGLVSISSRADSIESSVESKLVWWALLADSRANSAYSSTAAVAMAADAR